MSITSESEDGERVRRALDVVADNMKAGRCETDKIIHPDFISGLEALAQLQDQRVEVGSIDAVQLSKNMKEEMNEIWKEHAEIHPDSDPENLPFELI